MLMINLKDIITEGKGKQIGSMWNDIKKENDQNETKVAKEPNKDKEENKTNKIKAFVVSLSSLPSRAASIW